MYEGQKYARQLGILSLQKSGSLFFFFFLLGLNIPNAFREIFHLSRLLALHLTGLLACNEDSGVEWIKLTYILRKHTVC